jgi:hypothetical protein
MEPGETPPTPTEVVTADLKRYPELVEGAAESLGAVWNGLGTMPADRRAEEISRRLDQPFAAKFRNPEHVGGKLANGADPSPLRRALERNADRLAPGAVDVLAGHLAARVAGKGAAEIAGEVERFLGGREAHTFLAVRPEPPAHEQRIDDILRRNFPGELSSDQVARMVKDRKLSALSEPQIVGAVARTLRLPASDHRHGGRPASIEHRPAPAPAPARAEPARDEQGRFQEEPGPPPRRSLVR